MSDERKIYGLHLSEGVGSVWVGSGMPKITRMEFATEMEGSAGYMRTVRAYSGDALVAEYVCANITGILYSADGEP